MTVEEAIAQDLTVWVVECVGWHQINPTLAWPAVLAVGATSAAEAVVMTVASVSFRFLRATPVEVVTLKVAVPTTRPKPITPGDIAVDLSPKNGWRVDLVVLTSTGKRVSLTAWANSTERPMDPANAPS